MQNNRFTNCKFERRKGLKIDDLKAIFKLNVLQYS